MSLDTRITSTCEPMAGKVEKPGVIVHNDDQVPLVVALVTVCCDAAICPDALTMTPKLEFAGNACPATDTCTLVGVAMETRGESTIVFVLDAASMCSGMPAVLTIAPQYPWCNAIFANPSILVDSPRSEGALTETAD